MTADEAKPCPFCGEVPRRLGANEWWHGGRDCVLGAKTIYRVSPLYWGLSDLARWNRREYPAAELEPIEQLIGWE